jgi:hypothetical protein
MKKTEYIFHHFRYSQKKFDQNFFLKFGKKPEDYLQSQGEISAQVLREGAIVSDSRKSRKQSRIIDPKSLKFYSSSN